MRLFIKNMVCDRCKTAVQNVLLERGLRPRVVELGDVEIEEPSLTTEAAGGLRIALETIGFELLDDPKAQLVEKIRNTIIRLVHHTTEQPRHKISAVIASELGFDYPYLSRLFSEAEGMTIEQFLLRQKAEKVKEYLGYDELTLSQIADQMGYSSVGHLSAQFRKMNGMTPTEFKKLASKPRFPLDRVGK
jgi:AraC family transcriptional regulator